MATEIDLVALRSFALAAREGSLSRAAQVQGTSQPTVSQHLRRLEKATGAALLLRSARGVSLTETGVVTLRYAERILALVDDLHGMKSSAETRPSFRVGLLEHVAAAGLAMVLADFAVVHPRVAIEVTVADSAGLRILLEEGRLDLAIGDPQTLGDVAGGTRRRAMFGLVWAAQPSLSIDSGAMPLILFRAPCAWRDAVVETLAMTGQSWRPSFEASSLSAVQAAVNAGLGIAALLPGTVQSGMAVVDDIGGVKLPRPPAVELGLYRRAGLVSDPVLSRLEGLLWRTLG